MSITKYVGEQEAGAVPLFWGNGIEFPFRGHTAPVLKDAELDNVQIVQDFHAKEFDLSVPDLSAEYHHTMDRVVNGWYVCYYREVYRDTETGKRMAYVEWTQRYGQYVPGSSRGSAVSRG